MPFIIPEQGSIQLLTYLQQNSTGYTISFFTSPTSVNYQTYGTATTGSFSPATSMSPVGITLGSAMANPAVYSTQLDVMTLSAAITQTYTGNSAMAIYGFYLADNSGHLIAADSFPAVTLQNPGDTIILSTIGWNLTCA
jgi:hypothetical protein